MSNPHPGLIIPPSRSASIANGPPSGGMPPTPIQSHGPGQSPGTPSQQNLNQIVLEYLNKKGYSRTEATLRKESHTIDGGNREKPRVDDLGGEKYPASFELFNTWVTDSLELYRVELKRLLWPLFVYSILSLSLEFYPKQCGEFYDKFKELFEKEHEDDLRQLALITLPEHVENNNLAKDYRNNKYQITITDGAFHPLIQFLEAKEAEGGSVIMFLISTYMTIRHRNRTEAGQERSLAAMLASRGIDDSFPPEDEGIPGHMAGSANTDPNAPNVLPRLQLGPLPMDDDAMEDVRAALQDEDSRDPPGPGERSYVDEFEAHIKREPTEDAPPRTKIPLPPPLARDVAMEVQRIKENRDRFKIEGVTGGVGPGVSVIMYTFHNTFDTTNCIDISGDYKMVAAGTSESYIRVWSLDGKPLPSLASQISGEQTKPSASQRLVGHSGPVFAVSFSPSTVNPSTDAEAPTTHSRYLLSSSGDGTVRLWSIDAWACLVVYKGHAGPVWDVRWGPYGHYFATASHDRTARLWVTDHVEPLRLFVGHDDDVDQIVFHPNNVYVFTCSSDKTVRMWDIVTGRPMRMFTGFTGTITALACSPNGLTLATADDSGTIMLFDLHSGRRARRMRGHGKGGIWSLSWSVESTVLVSGGMDGTVRVWDCVQRAVDNTNSAVVNGKVVPVDGATGAINAKIDTAATPGAGPGAITTSKKGKGAKDTVVTSDQISAFPTKKSPVYHVMFTGSNLVMAAGAYLP
ncbi:putative transcription initiation factor TFIID subunit [Eremomyces bilateralis CBS 781.70]|uniref:Transcription initiation factor TFIID subunit n=1 Tax=Eremomyces bilateralis CBS 781.70 TaxID=1392243 RepID=A0A6G1FY06_9PEZI|nr:putative transcription initiation factor TFIID subunit [Eremomyces bilateralis CBS 781.70]KAF1810571.1 putative transcription initiation factor TFIID subunit [Eremomyces bilateralis CBS 781.70]